MICKMMVRKNFDIKYFIMVITFFTKKVFSFRLKKIFSKKNFLLEKNSVRKINFLKIFWFKIFQ